MARAAPSWKRVEGPTESMAHCSASCEGSLALTNGYLVAGPLPAAGSGPGCGPQTPPGPVYFSHCGRGHRRPCPRTGNPLAVRDTRVGLPPAVTRRGGRRGGGRPALQWG